MSLKEVVSITSTKGGIGKTTMAVNLAGALACLGMRVLLIDTDRQGSASKYYNLPHTSPKGFFEFVSEANNSDYNPYDCISKTDIENLDMVYHNDPADEAINVWLGRSSNHLHYLKLAITKISDIYDYIILDTIGTNDVYSPQEMAIKSSTMCVSPVSANWLSAQVFNETINMLNKFHLPAIGSNPAIEIPPVSIVLWDIDNTNDNQYVVKEFIQKDSETYLHYMKSAKFKLDVLQNIVPKRAVFNKAVALKKPVHMLETKRPFGKSASNIMLDLVHELFPQMIPYSFEEHDQE